MRSTVCNSADLANNVQNSFSLLRRVWDQLVSIGTRDDPVRWTRSELLFDQDAIGNELRDVGEARPSRRVGSRLNFDWDETIGRLDEIVGFPNESISPRH
jgi:hypothetical protein